jgi:hypothetical protein
MCTAFIFVQPWRELAAKHVSISHTSDIRRRFTHNRLLQLLLEALLQVEDLESLSTEERLSCFLFDKSMHKCFQYLADFGDPSLDCPVVAIEDKNDTERHDLVALLLIRHARLSG